MTIDSAGRIIIGGECPMGATFLDMCVVRYNPDGSLDTTFDTDGRVTTVIAPGAMLDRVLGLAMAPGGRIVAAGICDMGVTTGADMCFARYNDDGSLDTTFDTDGRLTTAIAPTNGGDTANSVVVLPDGRIVAAGWCNMGGATGSDICVTRYLSSGALDPSFDVDGRATAAVGPGTAPDAGQSIGIQADGRIVVGGNCDMGAPTGYDTCIVRFNDDGSLDAALAGDGAATAAIAPAAGVDFGYALALLPDGRAAVAGNCNMGGATGQDVCVVQFSSGGVADQYNDVGGDDWDTPGAAVGHFGACLSATTLSTPIWTTNAGCPTDDGAFWNAVPASAPSVIATANPFAANATATIRFGVRVAESYRSGDYVAPATFSVTAP
jgi:uncharacterized delta-60 repeat protein